jgi:hypothetical protein
VIAADAMHTQREHAKFLISEKRAHYILVVKRNQPSLYAQVKNLPRRSISAGDRQRDRGHGREEHRTLQAPLSPPGSPSPTPPRPPASPAGSGPSPAPANGGLISPAYERLLADWLHTMAPAGACSDDQRGCCCGSG